MYRPDFKILDELSEQGYLRKVISPCGKLMLYNYTDQCTYEKKWNEHTINARGTVYEIVTSKVIAKGFPKFFNFGELDSSKQITLLKETEFEVYEKMDGSLGIVYFYDGKWRVNTRGSFTSDQAIKATEMLYSKYDISKLMEDFTYLVEIIYPENRIIVDYGDEEMLTLLAGYRMGIEVPFETMFHTPFNPAKRYLFDSIDHVISKQSQLGKMEEGFVVRFKNGYRCKFKSEEYLKVAKIMSNCTHLEFWKNMSIGKVNNELLKQIPEEFRDISDGICGELERSYVEIKNQIEDDFELCCREIGYDYEYDNYEDFRKPMGLFLKQNKIKHSGAMFPRLLGDFSLLEKYIMKTIRPKNNKVVE